MDNCNIYQKSLEWCMGTPQLPGIARRVYYIAKDKIVQWPKFKKTEAGQLKNVVARGTFVLVADAVWHYIMVMEDKSSLTSEPQGEGCSQTQMNKLTAFHPGTGPEAAAAAVFINNCDNVFLVEDRNGNFRIVGSERWMTKGTVAQDTGQGPTGAPGTTISVEAPDIVPSPIYKGQIVTEEGIIDLSEDTAKRIIAFTENGCTDSDVAIASGNFTECSPVAYDDEVYRYALKMETNTVMAFSIEEKMTMMIVFANEDTKFTVKVDNVKKTGINHVLSMDIEEGSIR